MRTFFCTLIMSMVSVFTFAQTEPDFEMEPYVFNQADSTFATPLPCESAYVKAKAGASLFLTGLPWRLIRRPVTSSLTLVEPLHNRLSASSSLKP